MSGVITPTEKLVGNVASPNLEHRWVNVSVLTIGAITLTAKLVVDVEK
jgi:hypothetical protein